MGDAGTRWSESVMKCCDGDGEKTDEIHGENWNRNTRQEQDTRTPTRRTSTNDLTRMIQQR